MKIRDLFETKKSMTKNAKGTIPGLTTWEDLDNNDHPYMALRFGMMCAGSPEFANETHEEGPIGGKFSTISYSKAEEEILYAAAKKMGIKGKRETPRASSENHDVGVSPVSTWNNAASSTKKK